MKKYSLLIALVIMVQPFNYAKAETTMQPASKYEYNVESSTDIAVTISNPTPKATLSPEEEFKEIGTDVAKNNKYNALVLIVLFVALAAIVVKNNKIKKRKQVKL